MLRRIGQAFASQVVCYDMAIHMVLVVPWGIGAFLVGYGTTFSLLGMIQDYHGGGVQSSF